MNRRDFLYLTSIAAAAPFIRASSETRRFRTALIGCGWWGKNVLREAIASYDARHQALLRQRAYQTTPSSHHEAPPSPGPDPHADIKA